MCMKNKVVYTGEAMDELDEVKESRPQGVKQEDDSDPMTVALNMYPIVIGEQVIEKIRVQVAKDTCSNDRKDIKLPHCTGFCR